MRIDSLYVISRECQDTGAVYSVAAENLSSVSYGLGVLDALF